MARWLKAVLWVLAVAIGVVVLFTWVFPWVESRQQDPTMALASSESAQVEREPR